MFLILTTELQHVFQFLSKFRSCPGQEFKIYSCAAPASSHYIMHKASMKHQTLLCFTLNV